uniref:putative bifunctional diguanylate cyclase/phosphodiesterase n=1 Tax=Thaumasiovibrio occultus TaxID=1891184 RepID=UPI000B34C02B|nr:GGDEF domain-containing phosphodiesterase [Thaumasiovibrio occultus]
MPQFCSLQYQIVRRTLFWLIGVGFLVGIGTFILETQRVVERADEIAEQRLSSAEKAMALALYHYDIQQINALSDFFTNDLLFSHLKVYDAQGDLWVSYTNNPSQQESILASYLVNQNAVTVPLLYRPPSFDKDAEPIYVGRFEGELDLQLLQGVILETGYYILGGIVIFCLVCITLFYHVLDRFIGQPLKHIAKELDHHHSQTFTALSVPRQSNYNDELTLMVEAHNRASTEIKRYVETLSYKNTQLRKISDTDNITKLPNRRALLRHLHKQLITQSQLFIAYLDIDGFAELNNRFGHGHGDSVLRDTALILDDLFSKAPFEQGFFGRLHADDFLLVAQCDPEHYQVNYTLQQLNHCLPKGVTMSIGIALFPKNSNKANTLVHEAEMAMRQAKESGGACIRHYDRRFEQRRNHTLNLQTTIRKLIDYQCFSMHYQPKINMHKGNFVGCEALFRVDNKSQCAPYELLAEAERTGLIIPLGNAILEKVFAMWAPFVHCLPQPFRIGINISPQQLIASNFVEQILALSHKTGLPLRYVDLELVESAETHDKAKASENIAALRKAGATVSLDDFGTGFSSLEFLLNSGFDFLKIDRRFVMNLPNDPHSLSILNAIEYLSKEFNIDVVAEGVESVEQQSLLIKRGFLYGQGYLYSRPLPFADFMAKLDASLAPFNDQRTSSAKDATDQKPLTPAEQVKIAEQNWRY